MISHRSVIVHCYANQMANKICTGILYIVVPVSVQLVGTQYNKLLKQRAVKLFVFH